MATLRKSINADGSNGLGFQDDADMGEESSSPVSSPSLSQSINGAAADDEDEAGDEDTGGNGDESTVDAATPPAAPASTPGVPSTLAVKERAPLVNQIIANKKAVDQMKFGRTPEEKTAGLQKQIQVIRNNVDDFQNAELNRKGKDGISIMDQISQAKAKLDDLETERKGTIQSNQWGQIAEQLGNAITQTMAGMYGIRHNVNLSGMQFNRSNWEERLKILLGDVNDRMDHTLKQATAAQALAEHVGETGFKTLQTGINKAYAQDAKMSEAEIKAKNDMNSALNQATDTQYRTDATADTAAAGRGAAMDRAQLSSDTQKDIAGLGRSSREATALAKLNQEREMNGQAPLASLPGAQGSTPVSTPAASPASATAAPSATPGMSTMEAPAQAPVPATTTTAKAPEELSALASSAKTASLNNDLNDKMLVADIQAPPKNPLERKEYLRKVGDAKAEYRKAGGDDASNEALRNLGVIVTKMRDPANVTISGTAGDRYMSGFTKIQSAGIGESLDRQSMAARPNALALKTAVMAEALKGMKAVFGSRITNTDLKMYVSTVWDNALSPPENADRVSRVMTQIRNTRDALSENPEANKQWDADTTALRTNMSNSYQKVPKNGGYEAGADSPNSPNNPANNQLSMFDRLRGKTSPPKKSLLDSLKEGPAGNGQQ